MTTKAKKKPPRKSNVRQAVIPEMEPPSIPEIDAAADELAETRAARMALTDQETIQAASLLALMHQHQLTSYEYDSKTVTIASLEKVKVKRQKDSDGLDEDGEE